MILNILSILFFVIGLALAYRLWLSPLLRTRPSFSEFYRITDSFWASVWLKIAFLKTKLMAGFVMIGSALLGAHDFILPHLLTIQSMSGVDWQPLWDKIPPWAWPIISFSVGAIFYWLRIITAREHEQVVAAVAAGVEPKHAMMLVASGEPDNG